MPNGTSQKEPVYDYIIVGGGISGLSHAYHLGRARKKVLLLDAEDCLKNASFDATAIISHDPDAEWDLVVKKFGMEGARDLWKLSSLGMKHLAEYAKEVSPRFAVRRLSAQIFTTSPKKKDELEELAELYKKLGAHASIAEAPSRILGSAAAVISLEEEGQTNNQAILKTLIKRVRRQGATLLTHHRVEKITESSSGVEVTASGKVFRSKEVILTTGASSKLVSGVPQTEVKRTFVVSFDKERIPKPFKNSVLWDTEEPYHYIRSFRGRIVWVGGGDVYEKSYDPKKDYFAQVEAFAREKLGFDKSWKRSGEWSGTFYPGGKMGLPFMSPVGNGRVHVSYGFGGTGILYSFISGWLFTQWLAGKEKQYKKYFAADREHA